MSEGEERIERYDHRMYRLEENCVARQRRLTSRGRGLHTQLTDRNGKEG